MAGVCCVALVIGLTDLEEHGRPCHGTTRPDERYTRKNENGQHGARNPMLPTSILGTAQMRIDSNRSGQRSAES